MRIAVLGSVSSALGQALVRLSDAGYERIDAPCDASVADLASRAVLLVLPAGACTEAITALRAAEEGERVRVAVVGGDEGPALRDLERGADLWIDDTENPARLAARLGALLRPRAAPPSPDPVTGLTAERAFRELLGDEFRRAERYRRPLALTALAVDGASGAGPDGLALAAALVAGAVRDADRAGRLRGDRIGVLMPESDAKAGLALARRLAQTFDEAGRGRRLEARFGVASYPARGIEVPDHLLGRACEALSQARHDHPGPAVAFGDPSIVWARVPPDPDEA